MVLMGLRYPLRSHPGVEWGLSSRAIMTRCKWWDRQRIVLQLRLFRLYR